MYSRKFTKNQSYVIRKDYDICVKKYEQQELKANLLRSKLSEKWNKLKMNIGLTYLAKKYNVNKSTIWRIINSKDFKPREKFNKRDVVYIRKAHKIYLSKFKQYKIKRKKLNLELRKESRRLRALFSNRYMSKKYKCSESTIERIIYLRGAYVY